MSGMDVRTPNMDMFKQMQSRNFTRRMAMTLLWLGLILVYGTVTYTHGKAHGREPLANEHVGKSCIHDSDCAGLGSKHRPHVCVENQCGSKPLFPLNSFDIHGSIGAFLCIVISSGGGLGGGGLLVPLYIIVMELTSHDAIPLSKATIFGSAVASCLLNIRQKHPLVPDRQLIDYEVMIMMEPMTLAGTIIGVNMNKVFPEWIITILLVLLLGKTCQRMYIKGMSTWRQEGDKDQARKRKVLEQWKDIMNAQKFSPAVVLCANKWKSLLNQPVSLKGGQMKSISMTVHVDDDEADADDCLIQPGSKAFISNGKPVEVEDLVAYKRSIPWSDLIVLFVAWLGLFLYSILKGGHGAPSIIGLACGSAAYWSLTLLAFPFFAGVTSYFGFKVLHRHELLQSCGHTYSPGDIQWNRRTTITYPLLCTVAGIAAGLLGIGGGMVKGPLLLEIGLHPLVASATSSSMILFTSSATTIQFIVLGMLPHDYALWFGAVGFFGSFVGQLGLSYLIRKYRKTAFVLLVVATVIGVSGTVMGILGIQDIFIHGFRGFRSVCYAG